MMSDPMERLVADGLDALGLAYVTDLGGKNPSGLDFKLTDSGVEIEVKRFHSDRIGEQMSRAENVIAIQGIEAARFFAELLHRAAHANQPSASRAITGVTLRSDGDLLIVSVDLPDGREIEVIRECRDGPIMHSTPASWISAERQSTMRAGRS